MDAYKKGQSSRSHTPIHGKGTDERLKAGEAQFQRHHGTPPAQPKKGTPFQAQPTPPQGAAQGPLPGQSGLPSGDLTGD
jgi:hypothetical protein